MIDKVDRQIGDQEIQPVPRNGRSPTACAFVSHWYWVQSTAVVATTATARGCSRVPPNNSTARPSKQKGAQPADALFSLNNSKTETSRTDFFDIVTHNDETSHVTHVLDLHVFFTP